MSKKYGSQISFWSLPNECYLFSNKRYIRRGITLEFPLFGKENIPRNMIRHMLEYGSRRFMQKETLLFRHL